MKSELVERITSKEQLRKIFNITYELEKKMGSSEKDAKRISDKVIRAIVKQDLIEEVEETEENKT